MAERGLRSAAKAVFAGVDLFMGAWPGPRIVIYHQVTGSPMREMDITPGAFSRQVAWMGERGRIIDLESAVAASTAEATDRDFVLTFDDGYRGLFDHAFPLLKSRGIPFTLYITTGLVGSDDPEALHWDQVEAMLASGLMTVGAHTHTHPDLRDLTAEQVAWEVEESNRLIEAKIGVRPQHFAYPKGFWAADAEPVLKRIYQTAVLGAGPPISGETDLHRLSRVPVQRSDGHFFFTRKLESGLRMEEWLRRTLKGYENPSASLAGGVSERA